MNPSDAKHTLRVASQILEKLPVTWWLSAGTALGAYRDKFSDEFLLKDTDIDIGILGYGAKDILIDAFKGTMDLCEVHNAFGNHLSQMVFMPVYNHIPLDFYFFIPEGDNAVNYNFEGKMVKPLKMVESPELIDVHGMKFPVPSPIEEYLEVRYGVDWKKPKEHRLWTEHAANLIRL